MRSFLRTVILVCVLTTLLMPIAVQAADPIKFYACDQLISTSTNDPDGSITDPLIAQNAAQMRAACTEFEGKLDPGEEATVYWVQLAKDVYYEYTLTEGNVECEPVGLGTAIPGEPPDFGVALTAPLIVGGLILLGLLLLSLAWFLRRRLRTSARPA